jgi:NAD(P)-dependent dehydrogenase (short-subunit alcohol dehydrogenase family)
MNHVRDNGSITLTGGVLAHEPMPGAAAISMVNAGLEGFVLGASVEMPRGLRVNLVSPPWISETLTALKMDPSQGISAEACAKHTSPRSRASRTARRSTRESSFDTRPETLRIKAAIERSAVRESRQRDGQSCGC